MKGIYGYWDKEKFEYRYIGKDSHIDENKRYKEHLRPSKYDAQPFNSVLQNNPDRFEYQVFISGDFTDEELNELEMYIIKTYGTFESDTGFNFTPGGDGFGSGENHPMWGKTGEDNPSYRHDLDDDILVHDFIVNKLSCCEIARKYNTYHETVRYRLNNIGINTSRDKKHRDDLDDDVLVNDFLKNKLSCGEIAKKYNTGPSTVRDRLNKLGIDTSRDAKKNTTGYYRVSKNKNSIYKQGFVYRYRYYDENGKQKVINSVDLKKLEVKVKERGLPWKKL